MVCIGSRGEMDGVRVSIERELYARAKRSVERGEDLGPLRKNIWRSRFYPISFSRDMLDIRCVRTFAEHVNKVHSVGLDFSPCGRFVATGSEDRWAHIYDIRCACIVVVIIFFTCTAT